MPRPLVAMLLSLAFTLPALGQPATVRFSGSAVQVTEAGGSVGLALLVDGPGNFGGVAVSTQNGTALAGSDYQPYSDFISWPGADSENKYVFLTILEDQEVEAPETFTLAITGADGMLVGEPSAVTITILDGEGPEAWFRLDGRIEPNPQGEHYWPVAAGQELVVPIRLRQFPVQPATVLVQIGEDPTLQELVFDDVIERDLVVPGVEHPVDEPLITREIRIVGFDDGSGKRGLTTIDAARFFGASTSWSDAECVWCGIELLLYYFGFSAQCDVDCAIDLAFLCPLKAPGQGKLAQTLRDYRDQILLASEGGQYYADLYGQLSPAVSGALLRKPWILYDIYRASGAWLDALGALVAGNGDGVTITQSMQDQLLAIVSELGAEGGPELDDALQAEVMRIGVDAIAGLTIQQFQQAVEAAGASVPLAPMSWGALRARFGGERE